MTVTWTSPPPTRILSWRQMVLEADPGYVRLSLQPWVYQFSSGRLFVDANPLYFYSDGLYDNGGVLGINDADGWQTSSGAPGSLYTPDGGTINVTPGGPAYNPTLGFITFGLITAADLRAFDSSYFPTQQQTPGSGIIYNPFGQLAIS